MRPRVLVVDNSSVVAKQVANCFDAAGCEVVGICADGLSAVQQAGELQPDIVSFDLVLPRLAGLQMVASIKRLKLNCQFIAVSAVTARPRIATAKALGVRYYVLKAIDPAKLELVGRTMITELTELARNVG